MSRLKTMLAGAVVAACGLAGTALASPGYTITSVTMRAGPGGDYPPVVYLRPGTPTEVYGCLDEFTWCDVDAEGARGWVRGSKLDIAYRGQRLLLPYYGPRIGLPIVTFDFNDYWGRYYSDRPFFADRERWGRLPEFRGPEFRVPGYRGPDSRGPDYREPDHREPNDRLARPELRQPDMRNPGYHPGIGTGGERPTDHGGYPGGGAGYQAGSERPDRSGYQGTSPTPQQNRPAREPSPPGAGVQHAPATPQPAPERHAAPPVQAAPPPAATQDHDRKKHDQPGG